MTETGDFWEGVEIKHNIAITPAMIEDAYAKFAAAPVSRYYLLTTAEPNLSDAVEIEKKIGDIRSEHGCEVIANGLLPSIKYSLRLLPEPEEFLIAYALALQMDYDANTDLKTAHLEHWNLLCHPGRTE